MFQVFLWSPRVDRLRFHPGKLVGQAWVPQWHSPPTTHQCSLCNSSFQRLVPEPYNTSSKYTTHWAHPPPATWHFQNRIVSKCDSGCRREYFGAWCPCGKCPWRGCRQWISWANTNTTLRSREGPSASFLSITSLLYRPCRGCSPSPRSGTLLPACLHWYKSSGAFPRSWGDAASSE